MELHKWYDIISSSHTKVNVLSVIWNTSMDTFTPTPVQLPVQKIFDPYGVFAPTLMVSKLIIQESWLETKN